MTVPDPEVMPIPGAFDDWEAGSRGWDDIVGQEAAVTFLRTSLERQRWHHAYLFTGPLGVGKTRTALVFAQALLCLQPEGGQACDACPSCRRFRQGTHPDMTRVEPEGKSIGVDAVRALQRHAGMRPVLGQRRVVLLEPAEALGDVAQNALLKTLEEPPGAMVLILISHVGEGVLPTIVSRCLRVRFSLVPTPAIERLVDEHRPQYAPVKSLIAALSDGRPAQALQGDWDGLLARRRQLMDIVGQWPQTDPLPALRLAGEWDKMGDEDILREMNLLQLWFRDLLVLQECPQAGPELLMNKDCQEQLRRQAARWGPGRLLEIQQLFSQARQRMRQHVNRRLNLDVLLLRISQP